MDFNRPFVIFVALIFGWIFITGLFPPFVIEPSTGSLSSPIISRSAEREAKFRASGHSEFKLQLVIYGSSTSSCIGIGFPSTFRLFNFSLNGGNFVEMERLFYLSAGLGSKSDAFIFLMHPYLFRDDRFKSDIFDGDPRDPKFMFSRYSILSVMAPVFFRSGVIQPKYLGNGIEVPISKAEDAPVPLTRKSPEVMFAFDSVVFDRFVQLLTVARATNSGSKVVVYIPPIFSSFYKSHEVNFDVFYRMALQRVEAIQGVEVVDFRSVLSGTHENSMFIDESHLSRRGCIEVGRSLQHRLNIGGISDVKGGLTNSPSLLRLSSPFSRE